MKMKQTRKKHKLNSGKIVGGGPGISRIRTLGDHVRSPFSPSISLLHR